MIESSANKYKPLISILLVLMVVSGLIFVVSALPVEMLGEFRSRPIAWWTVPLIAFLQIVFLLLAAEIWRRVVRVLTGSRMELVPSYMQLVAVAVGKYVPGKVWGFLARTGDMYRQQIPVHMSLMSSVVEQLLVLAGALIVAVCAGLIAIPEYRGAILLAGVLSLTGVIAVSMNVPLITKWLLRNRNAGPMPARIDGYHPIGILRFALAYSILWMLSGAIFAIIYFSLFDVAVTTERVAALVLGNTIGIAIGFFAFFIPGGIGVREAIATGVLATFIPVREALLAAVAYRAWMVLIDGVNAVMMLVREAGITQRLSAGRKRLEK